MLAKYEELWSSINRLDFLCERSQFANSTALALVSFKDVLFADVASVCKTIARFMPSTGNIMFTQDYRGCGALQFPQRINLLVSLRVVV